MKEHLLSITKFNLWANTLLCSFLSKLTPEQFEHKLISSFDSIKETVYHIWGAEYIWMERLNGVSPASLPNDFKGSFNEFQALFLDNSHHLIDYIESRTEQELTDNINYSNMRGDKFSNTVTNIILHVCNHSTFHRGQIVTMLRNVGFTELSSTDYIMFTRIDK
jgi:uncharacterized damage-inducible protein DinB